MNTRYITRACALLLISLLALPVSASSPRIVVSIKPLHSLLLQLTAGVTEPRLLLKQQLSPHHFQLLPSQKRMLAEAELFIYSSDSIESFVTKLKATSPQLRFIEAARLPGIRQLQTRAFDDHHSHHAHNDIDGHIWLSIDNTRVVVQQITRILIELDAAHGETYKQNLAQLLDRLDKLKTENQKLLTDVSQQPFLVYHDALQYFEVENRLQGARFITTTPEHTPGIKRLRSLRQLVREQQIHCIFYEPPGIPPLLQTLTEDTAAKLAPIDPAGINLQAGPQQYFELMTQLASTLHHCLTSP